MVNVGMDDYGQQFFLEYFDEDTHKLIEVGCGAYNTDYHYEIERLFGSPKQCASYGVGACELIFAHGYCNRCPYNILRIERNAGADQDDSNQLGIGAKSD